MTLAGSTRMQAINVQTLFLRLAPLSAAVELTIDHCDEVQRLQTSWQTDSAPFDAFAQLTEFDAKLYAKGGTTQ